jgi:hypothetical protein
MAVTEEENALAKSKKREPRKSAKSNQARRNRTAESSKSSHKDLLRQPPQPPAFQPTERINHSTQTYARETLPPLAAYSQIPASSFTTQPEAYYPPSPAYLPTYPSYGPPDGSFHPPLPSLYPASYAPRPQISYYEELAYQAPIVSNETVSYSTTFESSSTWNGDSWNPSTRRLSVTSTLVPAMPPSDIPPGISPQSCWPPVHPVPEASDFYTFDSFASPSGLDFYSIR